MNLLTMKNISKAYTDRILLENADFSIDQGERIGIIGTNGTGKSTLLKLIAGTEQPDSGSIVTGNKVFTGFLPQNPDFPRDESVFDYVLHENKKQNDERNIEGEARTMLGKLGFTDFSVSVNTLSGGQKKKAALISVLLSSPDILLLDEPTNHLDGYMSEWLEDYLRAFKGSLVMVTHDRYFLDLVCTRIVEIDRASLYSYDADYEGFLSLKSQREEMALATEDKHANILRKELAWIKRGARARSTKQKARIERYEELRDERHTESEKLIEISSLSSRLGKKTLGLHDISKAYSGKTLFKDFTYEFLRTDRVGILGPNGCGKSTLIKILTGEVQPDSGSVEKGETVRIGYFAQESTALDDSMRVIDYIKSTAEYISTSDGMITASQMCEKFLFTGSMQYSPIGKLSGGEKRRLYLCHVLMEAPNVLILDEPTNDLDIKTLMILEDYLDAFPGILITVSHDRYFLDRVTDRMLTFESDGRIEIFNGSYTDYFLSHRAEDFSSDAKAPQKTSDAADSKATWKNQPKKLKFTFTEQKEYDTIESDISSLEAEVQLIDKKILEASTDFVRLNELSQEKNKLEKELAEKMDRYVYLEELAEKIAALNKGSDNT